MKIDTQTIEGYADMTPEQKIAYFEGLDLPEPNDNGEMLKLKNALNKASSDVASYKKQLQDRMTEAEKAEAAQKEMNERLAGYEKRERISGFARKYRELGYSDDLALKTAEAYENGDMDSVFANQKAYLDATTKALKEAALANQPPLTQGKPLTSKQIEDAETEKLMKAMMGF